MKLTAPTKFQNAVSVFWFRRDLRLNDNAGLFEALQAAKIASTSVLPIFIFDSEILARFPDRDDRRVAFLYKTLSELKEKLRVEGSDLWIEHGKPLDTFKRLVTEFNINSVYLNRDYEPSAKARDQEVRDFLSTHNIEMHDFKDHVVFENLEVTKDDGKPYTVYTPYSKKWRKTIGSTSFGHFASEKHLDYFWKRPAALKGGDMPTLTVLGFPEAPLNFDFPAALVDQKIVRDYQAQRDFPAIEGTSHLGMHLRFGTVSVREQAHVAREVSDTWYGELIWREFFMQIMTHFPHVVKGAFRPDYDKIQWRQSKTDFQKWCDGNTGVPIVDAGMRELNSTGFMHNRVRMITASFLTKSLLIDWRWGEDYFARKLLDFELASNNGNWQWVAGCGCDAAPYFRIFNPDLQVKRFDRNQEYIKTWVPEVGSISYPAPMVDHRTSRMRTLSEYARALGKKPPRMEQD